MTQVFTKSRSPDIALVPPDAAVLREVACPILVFDRDIADCAEMLARAMARFNGIGLAAPQVGWGIRMIALKRLDLGSTDVWCNPTIVMQEGLRLGDEGCLSLPGRRTKKTRSMTVGVRAQDPHGVWHQFVRVGLEAACVEHEIDHLNGVLMID